MTNSGNGEGIFKDLLETLLKDKYTPIEWEGYTPYDKLPPRPPLKQHKQVAVDPIVLQRYVGPYRIPKDIAPNIILTVRWEGNHLSVQRTKSPNKICSLRVQRSSSPSPMTSTRSKPTLRAELLRWLCTQMDGISQRN